MMSNTGLQNEAYDGDPFTSPANYQFPLAGGVFYHTYLYSGNAISFSSKMDNISN